MRAVGIDLGGTKIEAQVFDAQWNVVQIRRLETPQVYAHLVEQIAKLIGWADGLAGDALPVGIGAAGLVHPQTGQALTANLVASGRSLPADIATAIGRPITYVNDCRAFALSEAVLGAGQGYDPVIGLIIGTGLGGGICSQSKLLTGALGLGGEFGHVAAPATLTSAYNLPLVPCGCGRLGCAETYLSGPGMTRLALALTGHNMTPPQVAAGRGKGGAEDKVWAAWCAGMAEFLLGLTLNIDPEAIIIGGGLSAISGLCDDLSAAMQAVQLPGYGIPKLLLAQGGAASGARGAALAALAKPSGSQYG